MLRGKAPLIIAVALAGLATGLVFYQLDAHKRNATAGWELVNVVVATVDLQPGALLSDTAVRQEALPRRFVEHDDVLSPPDLENALGQEVVIPIKRGAPVHWYQLRGMAAQEHLSKAVRHGGRAISIDVSERSAVGHWVRPNDHVDVLGTFRDPGSNQMVAVTLLQDVIILATGQMTGTTPATESGMSYGTVTVLVDPQEAEIVTLAQELGSLYLSLRTIDDTDVVEDDARGRTTITTLLTGERLKEARERRRRSIQIIRGPKGLQRGR